MNNLVSIITPSFKSKKFIKDTIDSVLTQTYPNWEMIIVDDASPDGSADYIESIVHDTKIRLIRLKKNVGAAEARNVALNVAKGRYIAFLDSDDIWLPHKLEEQLHFMQTNNYAFTFTAYTPFSEDGSQEFRIIHVPKELDYSGYCKNTIIGCLTVMIDKTKVGDFKMLNIRSSHDMALWLDIMKRGFQAYGLDNNLARYRIVSNSNTSKKYQAALEVWDVYRKVEKLPLLQSIWYFVNYVYNAIQKRM